MPVEAIKVEGMVHRMFLAREGQAHELVVRTGVKRDGRIAVFEALQDGEKVVVRPPPGLRDGSRIASPADLDDARRSAHPPHALTFARTSVR